MKPEDYSAHKGFVNRLKYIGENTGAKTDRSLAELLYGHYPDLNWGSLQYVELLLIHYGILKGLLY